MIAIVTGLQARTQVLIVLLSLLLLAVVLSMVRRGRIREQYSLLWIGACLLLALTAIFIRFVDRLSTVVGIFYPPAFLFLIAILLLVVLQVHFSVVISSLREQNKTLAQELGILQSEVASLRVAGKSPDGPQKSCS